MSSSEPAGLEQDRLTALLEGLPVAAALFSGEGALAAVNALGRAQFVVDAVAPLASQHWRVVLHGAGAGLPDAMEKAQQGSAVMLNADPLAADSPGALRLVPFPDQGVLVTTELAEHRDADRLPLEQAYQAMGVLFEVSPASLRLVDLSGRIIRMNPVAGSDHSAPLPVTVRDLWERDAPHEVTEARPVPFLDSPGMRALAGHEVRGQLLEVRRLGGIQRILAYAIPLRSTDGRLVGVLLQDRDARAQEILEDEVGVKAIERARRRQEVTEAERIERLAQERSRALVASHEEQVRERRLAAVGQLAAGVMHDVNNALNPIMAAAYLLQLHADDPAAVRDYAARIQKAAETGAATASRVGRFIRQEPMHPGTESELDLSELVTEVLDLTEPMRAQRASDGHELVVERLLGQPVLARGIPGEIREAILNLVQNAIDAMPTGGTLTIHTANDGMDACLSVRDTGVGMSAEVRERAFEPFFTTKGSRGSGLGLAEVYGIARRHRGTVTIASLPSRGTDVTIRLPAVAHVPVTAPPAAPVTVSQHILVVEDHEDGREFLRRMLEDMGHRVEAVSTCADARACLRQAGPYDLLLTDVGLPDGNGWELVQEAHRAQSARRIGVLTGWEALPGSHDTSAASFILRKPLRATELQAQIAASTMSSLSGPTV